MARRTGSRTKRVPSRTVGAVAQTAFRMGGHAETDKTELGNRSCVIPSKPTTRLGEVDHLSPFDSVHGL